MDSSDTDRDTLLTLCNVATDLLCVCGFDGEFKHLNPAWTNTLGWSREELTSRPFMDFVHPDDVERTASVFHRLLLGGRILPVEGFKNRYKTKGGMWRWLHWSVTSDTKLKLVYATAQDVTDQVRMQDELDDLRRTLERQVRTDPATGLLNRRGGCEVIKRHLSMTLRYGAPPCSIVMIDIDHFKAINDEFGHARGDCVLVEVAEVLKNEIRTSDVVIRWGGEEFIVVLPSVKTVGALVFAQRALESVSTPRPPPIGTGMQITFSAGIAEIKEGDNLETLVQRADDCMYKAKAAGRNRVVTE